MQYVLFSPFVVVCRILNAVVRLLREMWALLLSIDSVNASSSLPSEQVRKPTTRHFEQSMATTTRGKKASSQPRKDLWELAATAVQGSVQPHAQQRSRHVIVVGDGQSGKSTLINTFLNPNKGKIAALMRLQGCDCAQCGGE